MDRPVISAQALTVTLGGIPALRAIDLSAPQELMERKGKYYRLVEIQSMSDKAAEIRRAERFE